MPRVAAGAPLLGARQGVGRAVAAEQGQRVLPRGGAVLGSETCAPGESIGLAQRVVVLAVVEFCREPVDGGEAMGLGGIAHVQHGREPVEQG